MKALTLARVCPYYYQNKKSRIGLMLYFPNLSKELRKKGIEEEIFTLDADATEQNIHIIKGRRILKNTLFGYDVYKKMKELSKHYDIIQTHQANSFLLYFFKKQIKAKCIHTLHGSPLAYKKIPIKNWETLRDVIYFYIANRLICKRADAIITVSSEAKEEVIREFSIDPQKVFFIPTGIDTAIFGGNKIKKDIDIMYAGRFAVKKNVSSLVEVIGKLRQKFPDIRCVFIGGEEKDYEYSIITKRIEELGLEKNIEMYPLMDQEELAQWYQRSKIFALLSYEEGMPKVILEALASGAVVIASRNSGMKDVVREGQNGFLVNPRDYNEIVAKMENVLLGKQKINPDAEKIRKEYSWEEIAKKTVEVYNKVFNKG